MNLQPLKAERKQAVQYPDDYSALLDVIKIDRELVKKGGLREYAQLAWPVLHPGIELAWGWAHDAITDIFDAWLNRQLKDILVNIPFRMAKSTIGSVAAPSFAWTKFPHLRFLTISYRDDLSTRDAVKSRRLMQSQWFQDRWGKKFQFVSDQNQKTRYENDKGGYRLAQSITGGSTGEGGNLIIWDDPHNVGRVESDVERVKVCVHHDEEMASRLDDQRRDGRAIIMQRLHENDLSGHVLAKDLGYVHLCLPMRFEPKRKCVIDMSGFQFEDPRTEEGELLEPIRFPAYVVAKLEKELGPYATAGQLQQQPAPRKGGMFDVDMIEIVDAEPSPAWMIQARYWDKAGTKAEKARGRGAFTAGVKLAKIRRGPYKDKFIVLDVIRQQWAAGPREQAIKNTAIRDGKSVRVYVEQEPGSGGKESAENTVSMLAGWIVAADRPTGDKVLRAEPMASQIAMGNFLMLRAPWNDAFLHELRMFPVGAQKDQVDAAAAGFNMLTAAKTGGFTW